ncbi:MAG: hypothetical protein AAB441_01305 [Patescibacteria group bacterium]
MEPEIIQKQIEDLKNKTQLTRRERRYLQKLESKLSKNQNPSNPLESKSKPLNTKPILTKISVVVLVVLIITAITWLITSRPNLPPIDLTGHIEQNPPSHILDTELTEPIQKHMLEHADGDDKKGQGVIIQYNCKKYSCEKDLIPRLTALVKKYPKNVYLAPGNYTGKIILTRLNKREILEKFDEKKIIAFIENK